MKKNLEILDYEDKKTNAGKRYVRFKTSEGWMSCFDIVACEALKKFENKVACVEVMDSGEFKNIKKCYGEAEEGLKYFVEEVKDEKPEVVKIGNGSEIHNVKGEKLKAFGGMKPIYPNNHTTMYTSYAKDIFCEIWEKGGQTPSEDIMDIAIELVKQAKEAFE